MEIAELANWELNTESGKDTHSSRLEQIFGYAHDSGNWNFERFIDHIFLDDRAYVCAGFEATLRDGREWNVQCRIVRAHDGAMRWIEVRGKADRHDNTHQIRLISNIRDITERKTAEKALQQYNEMLEERVRQRTSELTAANIRLEEEAKDRKRIEATLRQSNKMEAVGQLTGGIAHDFNNLLAGITGSLELMRKRIVQGRVAELERYIGTAMGAASRAAALTQRLLAFSRRQTLDPRLVNVSSLVSGMADLIERTVGPAIDVETRLESTISLTLCDFNQLENALLNLIINAKDAMPDGGIC